jgi:glycosyltransferase involved in cell wall biosynthesis
MANDKSILMVAGTPVLAGGEQNLLDLTVAAQNDGYKVGLVSPPEGALANTGNTVALMAYSLACKVLYAPMPKLPHPGSVRRIRAVLEEEGYGIVHAHGHLAGMYARLAARSLDKPRTVYTLHGVHYPHYRNPLKSKAFIAGERMLKSSTDRFICVCRHDLDTARELGIIEPDRTTVIYNGVRTSSPADQDRAADLRKLYDRGGGIVLHAGRFMPQKDHHTLIEALPLVLEEHPETTFLLAGSGRLLDKEKAHAARLDIPEDALVFLGESREMDQLMAACDFLVLSSLWEGFPYVVLEAMREGKAMVSTRVGGVPEAVDDGENGLLVESGSPDAFAKAVNHLLDHPEKTAAMGQQGLERVKDFSLESMAHKTLEIYEELSRRG